MKVKCLRFYVLETDHKCNSEKGSKAGRKARILVNGEEPKYSKVYGGCLRVMYRGMGSSNR